MLYTVYILFSEKYCKIYIGYTSHLVNRIHSHNIYGKDWTAKFRPWKVIYCEVYEFKSDAASREKQFKQGQGREWIWTRIRTQLSASGFICA